MNAEREEREATSFGAHAARNDIVRLILDGAPIDVARSSAEMNYELIRYHTALVLWHDDSSAEQGSFEDLVVAASRDLDERSPILIPSGASAVWSWFGSDHDDIMQRLKQTLDQYPTARADRRWANQIWDAGVSNLAHGMFGDATNVQWTQHGTKYRLVSGFCHERPDRTRFAAGGRFRS